MIKTSKQKILAMKTKLSKNQNIFLSYSIKAPCSTMIQWSSSLPFFLIYFSIKTVLCFIQIQMVIKPM
jgi:hypothetical protein